MIDGITINPDICHGSPCVKGTRIPVHVILDALASGMSFDQVIEDYPPVTKEDIQACIYYASLITHEEEIPLGA